MSKVAVLVLNRNMRAMTEALIDRIRETTHDTPYEIWNLDADSDPAQVVTNADHDLHFGVNKRWAWSFSQAIKMLRGVYTSYWCVCNDVKIEDDGTLDILARQLLPDACQIHPYQKTHPPGSAQGYGKNMVRAQAFVEFVCPLINGVFVDRCMEKFGQPGISNYFPYGWGVDYEMPYFGHKLEMLSWITDSCGIIHQPGTTHANHETTKVEDNNIMRRNARNSMLDELETRYGRDWGYTFAQAARNVGLDPKTFMEWSQFDRGLALSGARI